MVPLGKSVIIGGGLAGGSSDGGSGLGGGGGSGGLGLGLGGCGGIGAMGKPYTLTTRVPSLSCQVLPVRDSDQLPSAVCPAAKLNGPVHSRNSRDGPLPWQLAPVATVCGIEQYSSWMTT